MGLVGQVGLVGHVGLLGLVGLVIADTAGICITKAINRPLAAL